ncbi:MAG: pyridoxamine 5'-phosphate oxidase family protein [Dehalococcoidia bacterium]
MDDRVRAFLQANHLATLTTHRPDHVPHSAHITVGVVGDRLWSSGTERRMRTVFMRLDPVCTLLVFPLRADGHATYHHGTVGAEWLGIEANVEVLDGPDVPQQTIDLLRALHPEAPVGTVHWQGTLHPEAEVREAIRAEGRVIYDFEVVRAFGRY